MRPLLTAILVLAMLPVIAQNLVPSKNVVEKKWLKNQAYQMIWYALRDTAKFEIGKVKTEINFKENNLTIITQVTMKQSPAPWIDTTVAHAEDLQPIRHSSYNAQRDMVLNFGKTITGFYRDKTAVTTTTINETVQEGYYDSNIYPTLISWLPLSEGFKQDIAIYDYNPKGRTGVLKASVMDVTKGSYMSSKSGSHPVWVVTVSDEIGGDQRAVSTYYIGTADRKLWKQEINAGGRKMLMLLVESD